MEMADNGPDAEYDDSTPDIRDGLTRQERVVYISPDELSLMLARLGARR